jgi:leukotriene-A4 hydrolase
VSSPAERFPAEFLDALDGVYVFSTSRNSEILLRWQSLCLRCQYTKVVPQVVEFITTQGRMKFVRPLYRLLYTVSANTAVETFDAYKDL